MNLESLEPRLVADPFEIGFQPGSAETCLPGEPLAANLPGRVLS